MSDIFPPRMSIEGQLTAAADRIKELEAALKRVRGLLGDTNHDGSFIEIGKVRQAIIGEQNERKSNTEA